MTFPTRSAACIEPMLGRFIRILVLLTASTAYAFLGAEPSSAAETITFSYDALGRLTVAQSSGDVNDGMIQSYTYTPSDNRDHYTITGTVQSVPIVVAPLDSTFTLIPLPVTHDW